MLSHTVFSAPILFEENCINVLSIENPMFFTNFLNDIIAQINGETGEVFLSENYQPLSIAKNLSLITDILFINFENRKIITKLHKDLANIAVQENMYSLTQEIKIILADYISKLLSNSELPLSFDIEEDTQNLIKFANVKINTEAKSICEKALIYMDVIRDLGLAKYFIFVNLFSFVSDEDRLKLYEEICYKKFNVLFLENMFREKISSKEKYLLLDKDLCLVINDYCEKS